MTFRVTPDYDEVSCFLERDSNFPTISNEFTNDDFAREYDAAFDIIAEELGAVGCVEADEKGGRRLRDEPLRRSSSLP